MYVVMACRSVLIAGVMGPRILDVATQIGVCWVGSLTGPRPLHTGDAQSILNYHGSNRQLTGPIRLTDRIDSFPPPPPPHQLIRVHGECIGVTK